MIFNATATIFVAKFKKAIDRWYLDELTLCQRPFVDKFFNCKACFICVPGFRLSPPSFVMVAKIKYFLVI